MGQKVLLPVCVEWYTDCVDSGNWESYPEEQTIGVLWQVQWTDQGFSWTSQRQVKLAWKEDYQSTDCESSAWTDCDQTAGRPQNLQSIWIRVV